MITSASGWRKIFAASGDENDKNGEITAEDKAIVALAADTFADYMLERKKSPIIAVGIDTRPTGPSIAATVLQVLLSKKIAVVYTGIVASPEIMAYSRTVDGFIYISASHNPIGHNGIKFGLNEGGVLNGKENSLLVAEFNNKCSRDDAMELAASLTESCSEIDLDWVFSESVATKHVAASNYRSFTKEIISGTEIPAKQNALFARMRQSLLARPVTIVCDMNGSARTMSIDSSFLNECGIDLKTINGAPGMIAHEIIPEPENLIWCAQEIQRRQLSGEKNCILGYMPDCDGDRGNIVYWDEIQKKARVLKAQEGFALSVLSETAYAVYQEQFAEPHGLISKAEHYRMALEDQNSSDSIIIPSNLKMGIAVNGPTSMRIEDIAAPFGAKVFRAEVGEANVVNLARECREKGWTVRILGEGSNGGNITHPGAVRDPLCTIFALIKLLVLRDEPSGGAPRKGLFHIWCELSGQTEKYRENFTLNDIIATLPAYTTTGVSEKRAILNIKTKDHSLLKGRFQKIFEQQWLLQKDKLKELYGFESYEAVITKGTKETRNVTDWSLSGKGGLKILFKDKNSNNLAFIWMRGSGTEPVFRVMCDVKGNKPKEEQRLLEWETQMLLKADNM